MNVRSLVPTVLFKAYHKIRGILAAVVSGFPGRKLVVAGVTGTDGKTTTTNMLASILRAANTKVSWISTISARIGNTDYDTGPHTTTPSPFTLQQFLKKMVRDGNTHAVLEVTSHGIDQERIWGIPFQVGILTNVTSEHLDYHRTYENYLRTKVRLLQGAQKKGGTAIVNRDDKSFGAVSALLQGKMLTYGEHTSADVRAVDIAESEKGSSATVIFPNGKMLVNIGLPGRYNVLNALAAAAGAYALGIPIEAIARGIMEVTNLAGRTEEIKTGRDFRVIVDFAHTPNAFKELLGFWKGQVKGKIILVFGSAGERDPFKRPLMGEMAGTYADYVVLTREDNRSEPLVQINAMIRQGLEKAGKVLGTSYEVIDDREEAIAAGVRMAHAGDVVFVAGKGHESGLNIDGKEIAWDDRAIARRAIEKLT